MNDPTPVADTLRILIVDDEAPARERLAPAGSVTSGNRRLTVYCSPVS